MWTICECVCMCVFIWRCLWRNTSKCLDQIKIWNSHTKCMLKNYRFLRVDFSVLIFPVALTFCLPTRFKFDSHEWVVIFGHKNECNAFQFIIWKKNLLFFFTSCHHKRFFFVYMMQQIHSLKSVRNEMNLHHVQCLNADINFLKSG